MIPRLAQVAAALVVATTCWLVGGTTALAIGGGAGATGAGDEIITSILAARGTTPGSGDASGGGTGGHPPQCRTHVLGDRQIIFLLHVASNMPELLDPSFLEALGEYSNRSLVSATTTAESSTPEVTPGEPEPTTTLPLVTEATVTYWELTVRICNGVADTMSVQPRSVIGAVAGASAVAGGLLRHTTQLAPPLLKVSPPPRNGATGVMVATIVGEPVFFSAARPSVVRHTTTFGGRTVEVEATANHLELFSGQPGSADRVERCAGLGEPFDPEDDRSVSQQAADPGSCVLYFERATGGSRRPAWTGYAALSWTGRYRVDAGPWLPIDGLFSTSVFDIAVGEVETLIQDG